MAFLKCMWIMMTRVKAPQLPPLVPKSSSASINVDPRKVDNNILTNFASFCAAVTFGITVVAGHLHDTFFVSLAISGLCAVITGICTAEFLSSHAHNGCSVYISAYHNVCEFIAYSIGWIWMMSLGSCLAAICISLSSSVDQLTDNQFSQFFKSHLSSGCPDVLSAMFVAGIVVVSVTGLSYKKCWHKTSMSLSLACAILAFVLFYLRGSIKQSDLILLLSFGDVGKVITNAGLSSTAFLGCHSVLRLPRFKVNRRLGTLLSTLNIVCSIVIAASAVPLLTSNYVQLHLKSVIPVVEDSKIQSGQIGLAIAALCFLALEYYHLLLVVVQDISADGLLFRCLAKQWKPFCHRVINFRTSLLVGLVVMSLTLTCPISQVLLIASAGTLFVNLIVSLTVLFQRYRYHDSWRYEPMLPNGTNTRYPSRVNGTEFSPINNLDTTTKVEDNQSATSDSDDSSATDIDAVVQEYKEKIQLTNIKDLNSLESSNASRIQEPTNTTSFKSKMYISCHTANCIILGIAITIAIRSGTYFDTILTSAMIFTLVLSFLLLCFLHRLPQNKRTSSSKKYQTFVPLMPWTGGLAILLNSILLVHVVVDTWRAVLIWTSIGIVLYFLYGIRNSTAASPFHSLPVPALSMQPFPKEKASCHVMYPQKRPKKKKLVHAVNG